MSENKQSSLWADILKPVVVLTVICIVVSALLAVTNGVTAPIIERARQEAAIATRKALLPDATGFTELSTTVEDVESVHVDDGGTGYVIVVTAAGYHGELPVTVALSMDGELIGIKVDSSGETAGVGSKVGGEDFLAQYIGLDEAAAADGAGIDLLSGATISSNAVTDGVRSAFAAYNEVKGA